MSPQHPAEPCTCKSGLLGWYDPTRVAFACSTNWRIILPPGGAPGSREPGFGGRGAGGVKVFDTAKGEVVVSVAWIADQGEDEAVETPAD